MNFSKIWFGKIKNGKINLEQLADWRNYFQTFKENEKIELILRKEQKFSQRSNQENKYYWGVIVSMLSEFTGHTKNEIHEALKFMFLRKLIDLGNKKTWTVRSTTDLDTMEFENYCEEIRQWAVKDMQFIIPLPNEIDINL